MKSTAACLTVVFLGIVSATGCHQSAQRAASIAASLPVPGIQTKDFETRLSIARTHEREGKQRTARREYQRLLKVNPQNPTVHHRLGVIAGSNGDYDEANASFKRSLELAPGNAELIADWGYSLFLQGAYAEAEELTRQGRELAPHNARIANNLALIYQHAPMDPAISEPGPVVRPSDQDGIVLAEPFDASSVDLEPPMFDDSQQPAQLAALRLPAVEVLNLPPAEPFEPAITQATDTVVEETGTAIEEAVSIESAAGVSAPREPAAFESRGIGLEHVRKLLTRARLELAAGDVQMSHAFAEAAAEIAIPLHVFQERPEQVLDEIEFVRKHNSEMTLENPALTTAAFTQAVPPSPAPAPAADAESTSDAPSASAKKKPVTEDPQGFRAINRTSLSIVPKLIDPNGDRRLLPERRAYRKLSQVPVVKHTVGYSRDWTPLSYSWEAPQLKYNPLYFEDVQLERYGNEVCILQPFLSGARFYATLPTLPYQMMSEGNSLCHTVYDLGHDRPGNCVPYALQVPEFSWTGSLASGGWAYALIVILP
jgi:hypothetical protein